MSAEKKIEAVVGQQVQIALQSMVGSTGYGWYLTQMGSVGEASQAHMALFSVAVVPTAAGIAPVNHVFDFLATGAGSFKMVFALMAPWRPGEPYDTQVYEVTIKAPAETAAKDIEAAQAGSFVPISTVNIGATSGASSVLKYAAPMPLVYAAPMSMGNPNLMPLYAAPMSMAAANPQVIYAAPMSMAQAAGQNAQLLYAAPMSMAQAFNPQVIYAAPMSMAQAFNPQVIYAAPMSMAQAFNPQVIYAAPMSMAQAAGQNAQLLYAAPMSMAQAFNPQVIYAAPMSMVQPLYAAPMSLPAMIQPYAAPFTRGC